MATGTDVTRRPWLVSLVSLALNLIGVTTKGKKGEERGVAFANPRPRCETSLRGATSGSSLRKTRPVSSFPACHDGFREMRSVGFEECDARFPLVLLRASRSSPKRGHKRPRGVCGMEEDSQELGFMVGHDVPGTERWRTLACQALCPFGCGTGRNAQCKTVVSRTPYGSKMTTMV